MATLTGNSTTVANTNTETPAAPQANPTASQTIAPIEGAGNRQPGEMPGEREEHLTRFDPGKQFLASDGVLYEIDEHNQLVDNYGRKAGQKYQYEFQTAAGIHDWSGAKNKIPELQELEDAWNELTPEQQAEYKNGIDAGVAGVVSFIDNVLPVPGLSWAIGFMNPELARRIEFAAKANPGAAQAGMIAGTVVGLVGGPLAFAKFLRGGAKLYGAYRTSDAGFKAARSIRGLIKSSRAVLKQFGKNSADLTKQLQDDIKIADDFLKDWRSYEKQGWTQDAVREALQNRINQEGKNHIIRRALKGGDDVFENFWSRQVAQTRKAGGRSEEMLQNLMEAYAQKMLNKYPVILETIVGIGGDYTFNFLYSFVDWRSRDNDLADSLAYAFAFANDKTPQDILTELAGGTANTIAPNSKLGLLIKAFATTAGIAARFFLLYPDLDPETGQVDESVYDDSTAANRGGIIHRSNGGPASPTKSINRRIELGVGNGLTNKEIIADVRKNFNGLDNLSDKELNEWIDQERANQQYYKDRNEGRGIYGSNEGSIHTVPYDPEANPWWSDSQSGQHANLGGILRRSKMKPQVRRKGIMRF